MIIVKQTNYNESVRELSSPRRSEGVAGSATSKKKERDTHSVCERERDKEINYLPGVDLVDEAVLEGVAGRRHLPLDLAGRMPRVTI